MKKFGIWLFKNSLKVLALQFIIMIIAIVRLVMVITGTQFGLTWKIFGNCMTGFSVFLAVVLVITLNRGWYKEATYDERGTEIQRLCGFLRKHDYSGSYNYEKDGKRMRVCYCRKCFHRLETTEEDLNGSNNTTRPD